MSRYNACVILVASMYRILEFSLGFAYSVLSINLNYGFWYLLQADALKMALEAKNIPVNVYVGMRYWYPFTEEAIEQVSLLYL